MAFNKLVRFSSNILIVLMLTSSLAICGKYNKYLASISSMVISAQNQITLTLDKPINVKDDDSSCKNNDISVEFLDLKKVAKVAFDCNIERRANDRIYEIVLVAKQKLNTKKKYYIYVSKSMVGCGEKCIKLSEFESIINKRELSLEFNDSKPYRVKINSVSLLDKNLDYKVTIKREGIDSPIEVSYTNLKASLKKSAILDLNERLVNKDIVNISTKDSIGIIKGKGKFSSSHPKTSEDSTNYFSIALERDDNRDQKSIFSIKYKYDDSNNQAIISPGKWSKVSPVIDIDYNNKEKKSDKKATMKMNWSKYKFIAPKNNTETITQRFYNSGLGFEFEDNLKNKNVFINFNVVNQKIYKTGNHVTKPLLGFIIGRNLDLTETVDEKGELERYYFSRVLLDLNYSYKKDIKTSNLFNSFGFSISNKINYLLSNEVHLRTIKGNGDDIEDSEEAFYDKGLREFWEIEFLFGLSDRLGLTFKYENGKEPQFYRDKDLYSINLVYSY